MLSLQSQFMKKYQDSNPEKFNEEFLNYKEKDDESKYLYTIMTTLESIEGVKFVKMEEIPHKAYVEQTEEEIKENKTIIDISKSILKIYRFYFKLTAMENGVQVSEDLTMDLYYPKMIKGGYFLINNNRYFPVYQMLDSGFYNTSKSVTLKTLIMPIVLRKEENKNGETFILNIFKNKLSPFMYYFAKFGFEKTMEYFDMVDQIKFGDLDINGDVDEEIYHKYKISKKKYLYCTKEFYNENNLICNSVFSTFNNRTTLENVQNIDYWKKRLGIIFTTSADKVSKADSILISFERGLDILNKEILRLPKEDKEDIYSIVRYMMKNFNTLLKKSNLDLANKRLRCNEYMIYPLLRKFTQYVTRMNNSKVITLKKLAQFKCGKGYLIKSALNNDLLRYDNSTNSGNIISKLSMTQSGPQSQFRSGSVSIKYRVNHVSYVGKISLLKTSAKDPGASGSLTPFLRLAKNMHFTDEF